MKFLLYISITFLVIVICGGQIEKRGFLVNELVDGGGKWILAAAGSTFVPPPYKSCVNITVKPYRYTCDCIITNINLTVQRVRTVEFFGTNEDGDLEIRSKGPINEYTIKRRDEKRLERELDQEVDWGAAINQPLCWWSRSKPRKFVNFRYIVSPLERSPSSVLIVGVKERMPVPEYEIAILTRGIQKREKVEKLIDIVHHKNADKLFDCSERAKSWPPTSHGTPTIPIPWYWYWNTYCLPRLHIKCAEGYDILDMDDPVNAKTTHATLKPFKYYYSEETESLLVQHNK